MARQSMTAEIVQAPALAAPQAENPALHEWLEAGRHLVDQRRNVDWRMGDWLKDGQDRGFITQGQFDFVSDALGIAPRRLKAIAETAKVFPEHLRDTSLTIDHHAGVASLPVQEALPLLRQAKEEHWTPEQTRVAATRLKTNASPVGRPAPDEDSALESFIRHWNRLPRQVRLEAAELIEAADGEEIEP